MNKTEFEKFLVETNCHVCAPDEDGYVYIVDGKKVWVAENDTISKKE